MGPYSEGEFSILRYQDHNFPAADGTMNAKDGTNGVPVTCKCHFFTQVLGDGVDVIGSYADGGLMAGLYQACLKRAIPCYPNGFSLKRNKTDGSKWDQQVITRGAVKQNMVLETNVHYRTWSSTFLRSCLMHLGRVGNCSWYSV